MLNEWVDARLMEQQITRLFILFHTDTTFIDRPIDPVASPVETLLPFFGTHRWLAPSIRLFLVCLSLVRHLFVVHLSVSCALFLALYILKGGVPLQGHRPIVTYDYSVRTNTSTRVSTVLSRLSFILIHTHHAHRLLRLQKLLIYAAIDNRFFSIYTIIIISYF